MSEDVRRHDDHGRGEDWGRRAERWRGIRSETVDVLGTAVHLLRADRLGGGRQPSTASELAADERPHVLLHGLGGSAQNWLEVMPALAAGRTVVAPDLPGFGRTEPPRPAAARIGAQVGFVRALLDTLHLDEVVLHGNSMGGLIATLFAARHPERLSRLVLVDPALPGPRKQLHRIDRTTLSVFAPFVVPRVGRLLLGRLYSTRTTEQLLHDSQHHVHADPSRVRPELEAASLDNLRFGQETTWRLDAFAAAAASIVEAMIGSRRVLRAVDEVAAPTLVLWGEDDALIGRPVVDAMSRRRPDWELRVLEGIGHMVAIEAPETYLEVVGEWLEGAAGGPPLERSA